MRIPSSLRISIAALSLACLATPMTAPAQQAGPALPGVPAADGAPSPGIEVDRRGAALDGEGRIREVELENVPFNDVIEYLRDADPAFQAIVTTDPGVEPPFIQDLRLKHVSSASVLRLIAEAYHDVLVNKDDESGAWVIRVRRDPTKPRAEPPEGVETSVHRLREIVDEMENREPAAADDGKGGARKKAVSRVLSLLEAAITTDGEAKGALLRLHEETETLLFRGTPSQTSLVAEALESMRPPAEVRDAKDKQLIQALTQEVEALRSRLMDVAEPRKPDAGASSKAAPKQ